jgi:hypothetical protein
MVLALLEGLILVSLTALVSYTVSRLFWSSKHGQTNTFGRHGLPFGAQFVIYGPAFAGAIFTAYASSTLTDSGLTAWAFFASLFAGLIAAVVGLCHSPTSPHN